MSSRQKRKYWYLTYYRECPICGRGSQSRIRQHSKRPKNPRERFVVSDFACTSHFI